MGRSNITANMERELAYQLGEREETIEMIQRIEGLNATLPQLRERVGMLDALIKSAECLLREKNPDWSKDGLRPTRRWKHQSPIEFGQCTRSALEVLMSADKPLSTSEITDEVLARKAIFDLDKATREKVRASIQSGLRKHEQSGAIASAGHHPIKWWAVSNPRSSSNEQEVTLK